MNRDDIVRHAVGILDRYGLADLSMRRLAGDLGVQPSALYWHVANKQTLLAAVADEVLRELRADPLTGDWRRDALAASHALRSTLLSHRDGAEVVATAYALGLGDVDPSAGLRAALRNHADAAGVLLVYVVGYVQSEQLRGDAVRLGVAEPGTDEGFSSGVELILAGIGARAASGAPGGHQDSAIGRPSS